MRWTRRDWFLLIAITLMGAALRFYQIGVTPPGFQFDEAYNAIDAEQVLAGNFPLFLPANGGREVLFTYFQAGLVALLGSAPTTFRLASAIWGTLAVAATFVLLRGILRRRSRLVAALGALALAISYWHIHFSHYGIRVITMPVIFSALFGCYWAATHAATRGRRIALALAAGVILGLSVYSNPTGRLAPAVLIAYTVVLLIRHPRERRFALDRAVGLLLLAGAAAFVVFMPLGVTFWRNPEFFLAHAGEVSVFAERVRGDVSPWLLLADNVLHVLGMFSFYGDLDWTHGMAGRPTLDWVISIPFYIGVVVWGLRLAGRLRGDAEAWEAERAKADGRDPDADALWLLLLWAVVMLAPSVLSEAAPNYSRTLPALPAALLPVALGLAWIVTRRWPRPAVGYALAGGILAASLLITVYDYFVRFPARSEVYYTYDVDKLDALEVLRARQTQAQVYLSPLWGEHATVVYASAGSGIKLLDPADTTVLPAQGGAVYAFTPEETGRAADFAARWAAPQVEEMTDRYGRPLLTLVTLDAAQAQTWPPGAAPEIPLEARFDDAPTLLGMQPITPTRAALAAFALVNALEASPESTPTVESSAGALDLFWRAEAPTYRNLTAFAHLIDRDGARVAQADRLPGDGSYQTPYWSPGERVIDRLHPTLIDPCAAGDDVRALVGWYEYAAGNTRRPRLGAPGDAAVAGALTLPVLPLPDAPFTPTLPLIPISQTVGPVTVLGYALRGVEDLQAGSPFAVDLYMRAEAPVQGLRAAFSLQDAQAAAPLGAARLAPDLPLEAGERFCQRVRLRLPSAAPDAPGGGPLEGTFGLELAVGEGDSAARLLLGPLIVRPFTHLLAPPAFATPVGARVGPDIVLAGFTAGDLAASAAQGALPVEIVWQATAAPALASIATLQLLGPDGALVAQSDLPPGGEPTPRWAAGEYRVDARALELPASLPPGTYRLIVGLYDALSLERLPAQDASGAPLPDAAVPLTTFTLP